MQNSVIEILFEGKNFERLMGGLLITARISFISIIISVFWGLIFGLIYTKKNKVTRFLCRLYLELFRIIPILVWLFIFYFGIPKALGINIPGEISAVMVFILWGIAEMGDIARGALESLPKHQMESGKALGAKQSPTVC